MAATLTCWKEIANYLGRGVRTVQRWERESGLPVRRPASRAKGVVYAATEDLDAWLAGHDESPSNSSASELKSLQQQVDQLQIENQILRSQLENQVRQSDVLIAASQDEVARLQQRCASLLAQNVAAREQCAVAVRLSQLLRNSRQRGELLQSPWWMNAQETLTLQASEPGLQTVSASLT